MSRPINYDPRAAIARARFNPRAFAPVANMARFAVGAYIAQAAIGFAIGFTVPILHTMGVL